MKPIVLLLLGALSTTAFASAPTLVGSSKNPALTISGLRWDAAQERLRGTAYLTRGYPAPTNAHVHIYALNSRGQIVFSACEPLNQSLLTSRPQFPQGRDAFSAPVPETKDLKRIEVVATASHHDCQK